MAMRPAPPPPAIRPLPPAVRPAPPRAGFRPAPPLVGGRWSRGGFNWLRASADPYGYRGGAYGPAGLGTQVELGNVVVEDVYDDDSDMGGDFSSHLHHHHHRHHQNMSPQMPPPPPPPTMPYDGDGDVGCETTLDVASHADMGHEVTVTAAPGPVKVTFGRDWDREGAIDFERHGQRGPHSWGSRRYGRDRIPSMPAPPDAWSGNVPPPPPPIERPAPPPPVMRAPGSLPWGFTGEGRFGIGTVIPSSQKPKPPPMPPSDPSADASTAAVSAGQDPSFGWMMPTLPGAISDSPLRGRYAPDAGLGEGIGKQLGVMG